MRKIIYILGLSILGAILNAFVIFKPSISLHQKTPLNSKYIQNELLYSDLELFDGNQIKITEILKENKVILLDFWYLSCFPCLKAIPHVIELQEKYKDKLTVIGINDVDDSEIIKKFFASKKANYLSTYKTDVNFTKNAEIFAVPTMVLIDRQGHIIETYNGWNKRKIQKAIKSAIKN